MHKAYVGFSSPVGYDYANPATKCSSDNTSSPNPILVGVTGLLVLFDEIWFPCRSVCPESMRHLNYVKFVSEEYRDLTIDDDRAKIIAKELSPQVSLNDLHPDGFSGFMTKYYGGVNRTDNHTHGISCFGKTVNGNPDYLNLVRDLLVLEQLDGEFTHTLNGLTRKMSFPEGPEWQRNRIEDQAIRFADKQLTISSIYDLTGPKGPYHPVMEELREHDFVKSFRKWVRGTYSSLHNSSISAVSSELNRVTREFEKMALRSAVGDGGLRDVSISLLEGIALDLIPGSSTIKTTLDLIGQKRGQESRRVSSYIAESRGAIWQAHRDSEVHIY